MSGDYDPYDYDWRQADVPDVDTFDYFAEDSIATDPYGRVYPRPTHRYHPGVFGSVIGTGKFPAEEDET